MRRAFFWTGSLVVGLAALAWAAAPTIAQRGGHGGGGHSAGGHGGGGARTGGGGRAVARVGSVRYGARVAPPVQGGPAVRSGAVRSEHYASSDHLGGNRNPYREDYSSHFRPGHRSLLIGDASYYCYDDLPSGCQTVSINGITYYLCDGVYYQAYLDNGQTEYLVVPTQ